VDEYYLTTIYWVSQAKICSRKKIISCEKCLKVVWFFKKFEKFFARSPKKIISFSGQQKIGCIEK